MIEHIRQQDAERLRNQTNESLGLPEREQVIEKITPEPLVKTAADQGETA